MSANFTPNMHSYSTMSPFRYWVQKVLPLVYDDSLSYYELLNKVVAFLNNVIETADDLTADMTALYTAYGQLQDYVNEYFDNLDLSSEVDRKLDEMVADGTIPQIINTYLGDHIGAYVTAWLNDHPEATTTVQDGSITNAKLVQSGGILSDVNGLKEALDYVHATNITYPADGVSYATIDNDEEYNWNPIPNTNHPVSLPENSGFPLGANHVFVFGCQLQIGSGTTIQACDIKARLFNDDQNITIDCETVDHYHWTLGEDVVTVFFRFDVLGVFPLPSPSVDSWVVYLDFYNSVDAPDGINHMYITVHNPYFVDYTGIPHVQQISDWFAGHWTEEFVDCTRVWSLEDRVTELEDSPIGIPDDSITDAKLVQSGGVLEQSDNLSKVHASVIAMGGGDASTRIYLEEGDASGSNLYFKMISTFNIFRGYQKTVTWANAKSELNVETVTSPYGVSDCISIPNNKALVFDWDDSKMKFVERTAIADSHIVFFFNSYGRAEFPNNIITEYKTFTLQKYQKQGLTNVKLFGAVGNGSADDSEAIQRAIEWAKTNGGIVYFPKGTYLLSSVHFNTDTPSIASALMVYSGQVLLGAEGATLKASDASVTHMLFTYNSDSASGYSGCQNVEIVGLCFDSNSTLTGDITAVTTSHSANITIRNCRFTGGRGWHSIEINSSRNVHVETCVFSGNVSNTEDIQLDSASGNGNLGSNDDTVCDNIEISGCEFSVNGCPAIGNHTNAAHKNVRIHDNFFQGTVGTNGYISFVASQTKTDIYNNTFKDASKGITFANTSNGGSVFDNRFINVTTPMSGGLVRNDNIVNDVLESIFGSKGFLFPEVVSDLNSVMTGQAIGSIRMCQYSNVTTSNIPSNDSGICLSGRNTGSGGYGWQIAFTNNGFFWRKYSNSAFQAWTSITS